MMRLGVLAALGLGLVLAAAARADVESGPKGGDKVPALKAFGVAGSVEGKEADFAAERKDLPTVYLFVQAEEGGIPVGGRPLARFMKALDRDVTKDAEDGWIDLLLSGPGMMLGSSDCTPGYYNNEGHDPGPARRFFVGYPQGATAYFAYIDAWRTSGTFEGLEFG